MSFDSGISSQASSLCTYCLHYRYLAISGVSGDEGAIMTRNREDVDNSHGPAWGVWRINVTAGAWYRLVTNYDPWLPDPPSDPVSPRYSEFKSGESQ